MSNTDRFLKVLALAGSNIDGEALSALRKARTMLIDAGLSFTDLAQSIGKIGGAAVNRGEVESLRRRLRTAEMEVSVCQHAIGVYREQLECQVAAARSQLKGKNLRRSLGQIEARMRAALGDPRLCRLSDRELARPTGISRPGSRELAPPPRRGAPGGAGRCPWWTERNSRLAGMRASAEVSRFTESADAQ